MDRTLAILAAETILAIVLVSLVATSVPLPHSPPADAPPDNGQSQTPEQPMRNDSDSVLDLPDLTGLLRWIFLGALIVTIGRATLAIWRLQNGGTPTEPPADSDPELDRDRPGDTDVKAARDEAERAADRIERGEVTPANEVYQAWYKMTQALGPRDPRSETPGRFAELAIRAGMDRDTVWELTNLFTEVRYSDRELTDADETRAAELLRRLSRTSNSDGEES